MRRSSSGPLLSAGKYAGCKRGVVIAVVLVMMPVVAVSPSCSMILLSPFDDNDDNDRDPSLNKNCI